MRFDMKMRGVFKYDSPVIEKNFLLNGFIWSNNHWITSLTNINENEAIVELTKLISRDGIKALRNLDGSFLMMFYDQKSECGYLYRSLLCKMSLYYRIDNGVLRWSTNPIELLDKQSSIQKKIRKDLLLAACFDNNPPNGESFYNDIYILPAGYGLIYKKGTIQIQQFDSFSTKNLNNYQNIWDYVKEADTLIEQTFKRRFSANETVAVQLSGGIDSASLLCRLKQMNIPVVAYHWSFTGIEAADETHHARLITKHLDVPLYTIDATSVLTEKNYLNDNWNFQAPYGHSFYKLFELTAKLINEHNINIVVNGHFGDHIFGPLPNFGVNNQYKSIPIRERFRYWIESLGTNKSDFMLDKEWDKVSPKMFLYKDFLTNRAIESAKENSDLLKFPESINEAFNEVLNHESESSLQNKLFEQNIFVMYPFASRELIEFSLNMPYLYRNIPSGGMWIDKPILRLMNINKLPHEITSKNYNYHMGALDEQYIIENSQQIKLLLEDSYLTEFEIIDPDKIRSVLNNKKLSAKLATSLIACCMVEIWLQNIKTNNEETICTNLLIK